jgi:pimeloyl-ACP methyl ester carboxylesterase
VNKLNTSDLHFMGHSFGAATALTAASRRPDLLSSVIAHEPAVDWMPDDARRALFTEHKLEGGPRFTGGTGGYETHYVKEEKKEASNATCQPYHSLHDIPMLFLYSDEWKKRVRIFSCYVLQSRIKWTYRHLTVSTEMGRLRVD